MSVVTEYDVLLTGHRSGGGHHHRAQITAFGPKDAVGMLRFYDTGADIPDDYEENHLIFMHLPMGALAPTLDILRNESPLSLYFSSGRGRLITGSREPVGEGE